MNELQECILTLLLPIRGLERGACVVENFLKTNLLHFACHQHIHELIIGEIIIMLLGPSGNPNVELFEKFRIS